MKMMVYKIHSGQKWYQGNQDFAAEEHNSPMFTNRSKAEKTIRNKISQTEHDIEKYKDDEGVAYSMPGWVRDLVLWRSAEIASYELVRVE